MQQKSLILTCKQAGELCQLHEQTIRKLVREGKIPAFHAGPRKGIRIRKDVLLEVIGKGDRQVEEVVG